MPDKPTPQPKPTNSQAAQPVESPLDATKTSSQAIKSSLMSGQVENTPIVSEATFAQSGNQTTQVNLQKSTAGPLKTNRFNSKLIGLLSVMGLLLLASVALFFTYRSYQASYQKVQKSRVSNSIAPTTVDLGGLAPTSSTLQGIGLLQVNGDAIITNNVTANSFSGSGADLSNVNAQTLNSQPGSFYLNASNIDAGTLGDQFLSPNVALLDANQAFTGSNSFGGSTNFTGAVVLPGTLTINSLTYNMPGSQAAGTLSNDGTGNLIWQPAGACPTCVSTGGNSFGAAMSVGTNDNFSLSLRTNGITRLTFNTAGDATFAGAIYGDGTQLTGVAKLALNNQTFTGNSQVFQNNSNSTSAFSVKNAGAVDILSVDSTNSIVNISNLSAGSVSTNTITPTGALTIGSTGQALTLQGNASTKLTATGADTFLTSVGFSGIATGAVTYNFDRSAALGTYNICTSAGNCTGVSGSVGTPGGTANKLAKFSSTYNIVDSIISDNGSLATIGGSLEVDGSLKVMSSSPSYLNFNSSQVQVYNGTTTTNYNFLASGNTTYDICTSSGNCLGGGGGGANTALSNLASVAINTSLLPGASTAIDLGSNTLPLRDLYIYGTSATPASQNFKLTGAATAQRTITFPDENGTVCTTGSVCSGYGNNTLSNLGTVALNSVLQPASPGSLSLGVSTLPFSDLYLSGSSATPATNRFQITGTSTGGLRVITMPDATGTICLENSASCGFAPSTGSTSYFAQNGNSFGGTAYLGTTDANDLVFRTGAGTNAAQTRFTVDSGAATLTGTGATTLTSTGATTLSSAAASNLTIASGTTGAVSMDSGTSGTITIGGGIDAKTINLGTGGTGAKTVILGSTASTGTTTINAGTGGIAMSSTTVSGTGLALTTASTTGGIAMSITANALTSGTGLNVTSSTTSTSAFKLTSISASGAGNTGTALYVDNSSSSTSAYALDIAGQTKITASSSGFTALTLALATGSGLTGINFNTNVTANNAIKVGSAGITSGSGIIMSGTSNTLTTAFTGSTINITPSRTYTATGLTNTGNELVISRTNAVNVSAGTLTVTGDVASISSTCTQTLGTCNDSSRVLSVSQNYANATGKALYVTSNATAPSTGTSAGIINFNFTGNRTTATNGFQIDDASTTLATTMAINSNSLTTGIGLALSVNGLTTGTGLSVSSSSTAATYSGDLVKFENTGNSANVTGSALKVGITGASAAGTAVNITNAGTGLSFRVNDDGTYTDSTPVVVDASGNVGIGTATPGAKLEVAGSIVATGASGFISSPYSVVAPLSQYRQGSVSAMNSIGTPAAGTSPNGVAVDPSGRFAYVVNAGSNTVQAYTINQSTGALTSVGTTATGTLPIDVAVDPSGRFAYVTNYGAATVQAYTINQSTGALTSVGTGVATGTNPAGVAVDPSGRFAYVANYGASAATGVQAYTINQTTGALTSVGTTPTGSLGYAVAVDPSGRFAYVTNQGADTVQAYTINQSTGALTSVGTGVATGSIPYGVAVDSSGRFAYVANNDADTVQAYTINQSTGALTSVGITATGPNPSDVAVDPSGRFVYVANTNGNIVQAYTINQSTGALTTVGTTATGTSPNGVAVDPSGRFVYVANAGSNTVQAYTGLGSLAGASATFTGTVGVSSPIATGTALSLNANSLTTGNGLAISATNAAQNFGTSFSGKLASIDYTKTFTTGTGPATESGNVLSLTRSITANLAAQTANVTGAILNISDSGTQTAGTLTNSASVVSITQGYAASTGKALYVTSNATAPSTGTGAGIINFNFTGNRTTATNGFQIDDASTTLATTMAINANALTTGNALAISANALTTGAALSVSSSTTGTAGSTTGIVNFTFSGNRTGVGSGFLITDSATTSATTMQINANSLTTGTAMSISATALSSGVGLDIRTTNLTAASSDTDVGAGAGIRIDVGNAVNRRYMVFMNGASPIGSVTSTSATTVFYNQTSDARLKENIVDTAYSLDTVMALKVHDYNFINDPGKTKLAGFIAQELYQLFPEAVTPGNDAVDANGVLLNPWGVDYGKLTPLLAKGIQELNTKVDASAAGLSASVLQTLATANAITINGTLTINGVTIFNGNAKFNDEVQFNPDTTGTATIPAGQTSIAVTFSKPMSKAPRVTATPQGIIDGSIGITSKTVTGFTIQLQKAQIADIDVDWQALISQ